MNDIIGLDKIYVLNHISFGNRRDVIEKRLKEENIEYKLVQNYPPEEIDYEKELIGYEKFEDIDIIHPYGEYRNFSKKISVGSLSLVLKHLWCYRDQIENQYENILILEDDCHIPSNFNKYLNGNMKDYLELKETSGVGMLMVGMSHHFISKNLIPGKYAHYSENQKCRCTHGYIVNINTTKIILENFHPINLPIDFKLNEIMQLKDIKVAWSEPGLNQI